MKYFNWNLCYSTQFTIPPIFSVYNGREYVSYIDSKIKELIPPASRPINLSLDRKTQLRSINLVNHPADYGIFIYHKLLSNRINYKKRKGCFPTSQGCFSLVWVFFLKENNRFSGFCPYAGYFGTQTTCALAYLM